MLAFYGGRPCNRSSRLSRLARIIARAYFCPHFREGEARQSSLAIITPRVKYSSQIVGGPENRSSRVSQLARIGDRAYHCSHKSRGSPRQSSPACITVREPQRIRGSMHPYSGREGPGNHSPRVSQLARVVACVYHCTYSREGEDQATTAPALHSSRVSLLAL